MRSLLVATVVVLSSCAEQPKKVAVVAAVDRDPALDRKLAEHRALMVELRDKQEAFLAAEVAYEQRKGEYLDALSTGLAGARGVRPVALKTVLTMAGERGAIGSDLEASLRAVGDALLERAAAEGKMLGVEGRLWQEEAEAWGGHAAAGAHVASDVLALRDALTNLHVAQKAQQASLGALVTKEFEFNASIGEDTHARDFADRQLTLLRTDVEGRYDAMIEAAKVYDAASDRVHRRLLKDLPPGKPLAADRIRALLIDRDAAAATVAAARAKLKEAVVRRAELRQREIAHDGEMAALLDGAFRDGPDRDAFLLRMRDKRDEASAARVATQNAETALGAVRKKMATVEGDITALGY